jgi:hypothetical protein
MTDPIARTFLAAATAYIGARKPTLTIEHDFLVSLMELVAHKSGVKVRMIVGDGVITRGEN